MGGKKGVPQLRISLPSCRGSSQPARELRLGKRAAIALSCLPSSAKTRVLTMQIAGLSPLEEVKRKENLLFKYRGY